MLLWRCMRSVCSCCWRGGGLGAGACCGVDPPCRPSRTWWTQGGGPGLLSLRGLALRRRVRPSQSGSLAPPCWLMTAAAGCVSVVFQAGCGWWVPVLLCHCACLLSVWGASLLLAWWVACGCVAAPAWCVPSPSYCHSAGCQLCDHCVSLAVVW